MPNPFEMKPNRLTALATLYPLRYSLGSAVLVAVLTVVYFGSFDGTDSVGALLGLAAAMGAVMFLLNFYLWRRGGPGATWADDNTAQPEPAPEVSAPKQTVPRDRRPQGRRKKKRR